MYSLHIKSQEKRFTKVDNLDQTNKALDELANHQALRLIIEIDSSIK